MANANVIELKDQAADPYSYEPLTALLELRADVRARIERLKNTEARVEAAIMERCAPAVTQARQELQKFEGRVRVVVEGIEVLSDVPKRVEWSTDRLDEIADQLEATTGMDPTLFIDHKLSVSEAKYKSLPPPLRELFDTARVVKHGKEKLDFPNA